MAKQGFKNQWIAISRVGKFADSEGVERDLNEDFLSKVVANFTPHDAPAVIGHPKDNTPAFGWTFALRLENGVLEAQFADVDDDFEAMVEAGKFRKRSASFYVNPPNLKHVGFLGAMPPAVKGLKNIQFAEGETVTFENSFFNLNEEINMGLEDKDVEKVTDGVLEKIKNFFSKETEEKPTAAFSESQVKDFVAEALKTAKQEITTEFSEKVTKLENENKSLRESVDAGVSSGKRAEIVKFVEAIPAEKGKHFLKRNGIVEFMESLAKDDAADAISFAEGDTTHKLSTLEWFKNYINAQQNIIEFGEKFGNITATKDADVIMQPGELNNLRDGMGVKTAEGGAK